MEDIKQQLTDLDNKVAKIVDHQHIVMEHQKVNDEMMKVIMQRSEDVVQKVDFFMEEIRNGNKEIKEKIDHHDYIIAGNGSPGLDEKVRNLSEWKDNTVKTTAKMNKQMLILGAVLVVLLSVLGQNVVLAHVPTILKLLF